MKSALRVVLLFAVAIAGAVYQAAPAAAQSFSFYSEKPSRVITAKDHASNGLWTFDSGLMSCDEVTYSGEASSSEATEFSVYPTYSGCKAFGLFNVPVDTTGCAFRYQVRTIVNGYYEGRRSISCSLGKKIEITAPGCTVTISSQAGLETVTFTNLGAGTTRELTVDENLTGIAYTEHPPKLFGLCASNTAPRSNGTFAGYSLHTATDSGTHQGFWAQ